MLAHSISHLVWLPGQSFILLVLSTIFLSDSPMANRHSVNNLFGQHSLVFCVLAV